jgi:hypothetical protein
VNPQAPNTIEYGQRLANAYGVNDMDTNQGQVPGQLAAMQTELARMMAQPQFTPELAQLMARKSQQDASALPLAVGALLSGDKGIRELGAKMYEQGQRGRDPIALGDDAFIDPATGQLIANPMGDVNRSMSALPQAVSLYNTQQKVAADYAMRDAQLQSANTFKELGANIQLGNLNARNTSNQIAADGLSLRRDQFALDGNNRYLQELNGVQPGLGGGGAMMTGQQPSALPMATGQQPAPEGQPGAEAGVQQPAPLDATQTPSALPNATGQAEEQSGARTVSELPPNAEMLGLDLRTGEPVYRVGGRTWKPNEAGTYTETKDVDSTIAKPEWDKRTAEVQREAAALARNKRIIEQVHANPEAFSDFMAFVSGATPHWMSDRVAKARLTPEQFNLRTKILSDAAEAIHELYGAALTSTETKRAMGFNIDQTSPNEKIIAVLSKVPSYTLKMKQAFGDGVFNSALKNGGINEADLTFPTYDAAAMPKPGSQAAPETQVDDISDLLKQYSTQQ